jgi:hypothetical protein
VVVDCCDVEEVSTVDAVELTAVVASSVLVGDCCSVTVVRLSEADDRAGVVFSVCFPVVAVDTSCVVRVASLALVVIPVVDTVLLAMADDTVVGVVAVSV